MLLSKGLINMITNLKRLAQAGMIYKTLIPALVSTMLLLPSTSAHTSLIIGNQEFLDLGVTQNKNYTEMLELIDHDTSLAGYTVASDIDMAMIHGALIPTGHTDAGWHALPATQTPLQHDILNWYGTSWAALRPLQRYTSTHGDPIYHDRHYWGYINYANIRNSARSGFYDILENTATGKFTGIKLRGIFDPNNLASTISSAGNFRNTKINFSGHLFVRDVVLTPEPSILSIFALGLIGLGVRRLKKLPI
jgi:hypothetical protein